MTAEKRPVARLTVIVPPELASGFRLAGIDVDGAIDVGEASAALTAMLDDALAGVAAVYAPFHAALAPELAERCDRSTDPIVVPLPAGLGTGDATGQRARIAALLERAVGYHIAFPDEVAR